MRKRLRLFARHSISDQAFRDALDFLSNQEKLNPEIANFLDFRMRELGASGLSFDTILASGNSSKPHAHPMHKPVEAGHHSSAVSTTTMSVI